MDGRAFHFLAAFAMTLTLSDSGWAQCQSGCGCGSCNRGAVSTGLHFQPPPVRHDRVSQFDYMPGTAYRGYHGHGHEQRAPHYTPAHAAPHFQNHAFYPRAWR